MFGSLAKVFDLRPGEARPVVATFASLLFIVVAHTLLETARDALFLIHVGAAALGWMYIVAAAVTLVAGWASARMVARIGARRALTATQIASAFVAAGFYFLPPSVFDLTALYAAGAVIAALLVPQLWATAAALFHVGQARRIFGIIAVAGVLGAVIGSGVAALALTVTHVRTLLLLSGMSFAISGAFIRLAPEPRAPRLESSERADASFSRALRAEPILFRIALVVVLGTMTTLLADYLFKSVAVSRVPKAELGSFLARYYTAMNFLALVVQLVVARKLLARAGIVRTLGFTPLFMLLGSTVSLVSSGALFAVIGTKVIDAATRHSVYRTGLELVYLAVPARARDVAKPIIDGALTRLGQAGAAGLVLVLLRIGHGSVFELALLATLCAGGWVVMSASLHRPYVALFRRALLGDSAEARLPAELDLASIELLVEALSSPRPREVLSAMDALGRRGRAGLVPALVLLREEGEVIVHALDLFGATQRGDWVRFAERFTSDRREPVQRAAMRALARAQTGAGEASSRAPLKEDRPWIQGYLAIREVAAGNSVDLAKRLTPDARGKEAALGMLTALRDAEPSAALVRALEDVLARTTFRFDREATELASRAAASVGAASIVPWLVDKLDVRDARAGVRASLVAIGAPAFDYLATALGDARLPRKIRLHVPLALAEFRTQRAADRLFEFVASQDDGFVRYRALRALEQIASDRIVKLDGGAVRKLVRGELGECLRALALAVALERAPASGDDDEMRRLLVRLLREKSTHAVRRAFRLLKLWFPSEDLQQVRAAIETGDEGQRANAAEFLDALLAPGRREPDDGLRPLLRVVVEDLTDAERIARGAALGAVTPVETAQVTALLRSDADAAVAELASELTEVVSARARKSERPPSDSEAGGIDLLNAFPSRGT